MKNNVEPEAKSRPLSGNSFEKYLQQKDLSKATIKCYNDEMMEVIVWCDLQNIEVENTTSTEVTS